MNKKALLGLCVVGLALLAGCGQIEPPRFRANMVAMEQQQIPENQQQDIANILEALYGTPDEPFVLPDTGLDLKLLQVAAGPVRSDRFGKETGVYRRQCGHCHGTTGDGMGPTAMLLNPYPRDYRQGKFKFKSTERPDKPTEADLERIVRQGVPGTAMPAFDLLPDSQIKALVEYVKYLSLRGETELRLIGAMADLSEGTLEISRGTIVDEIVTRLAETWKIAPEKIIAPPAPSEGELAESIDRGRKLFYSEANCAKCHGWSALGDGQTNDYDDWNKTIFEATKGLDADIGSLKNNTDMPSEERSALKQRVAALSNVLHTDALPLRNAIPRNLRQNVYRGGRRPLDLYRRMYAGINGVPMPAAGPTSPGGPGMNPEQIWDLVHYVLSLPYEPVSQPLKQQNQTLEQARF